MTTPNATLNPAPVGIDSPNPSNTVALVSSTLPMPLFPPLSVFRRMANFSDNVYRIDESSLIFKLLDSLCGDSGAGAAKKQMLINRLSSSLDSTHFFNLDRLYSHIFAFTRLSTENYPYNPELDMLESDAWDAIKIKDAEFRARCNDFMVAANLGGTLDGIERAVKSATGEECDLYEVWRYRDNYGITQTLGRTGVTLRNELVIQPLMSTMSVAQKHYILEAVDRIKPVDSIITVNILGLAVHTPVTFRAAGASDSYFEIQKKVVGIPDLSKLPPPAMLASDFSAPITRYWLPNHIVLPKTTPTFAMGSSSEHISYYTLAESGGAIDSIDYGKAVGNGSIVPENIYVTPNVPQTIWSNWTTFDTADSPDNYPGGKRGLHPDTKPAVTAGNQPYIFPYPSQTDYLIYMKQILDDRGGEYHDQVYRLPLTTTKTTTVTWRPRFALPIEVPVTDSTITIPWINNAPNLQLVATKKQLSNLPAPGSPPGPLQVIFAGT